MRDSHPSVGFPKEWEPNYLEWTNRNGTGMGIAQMGMGTLINNVFPFSHTFPLKSVFDLVDL